MSGPELLLVSTPLHSRDLPGGVCPSLSNLTLGSALRAHGADIAVLNPSVDVTSPGAPTPPPAQLLDAIAEAIVAQRPQVVGVSALSSVEGRFAAALARAVKARAPGLPVVAGGIWATARAEALLARCPELDGVIGGAGEAGALELTRGGLLRPESVPGLWWRAAGGGVAHNPAMARHPDSVPLDLSLMAHPERYDIFCWLTSRGCPFDCNFCTDRLGSPAFTLDGADKVAADLARMAPWHDRWYLSICDPLFGANRPRTHAVCDAIKGGGFEFLAESRVDVLDPDDVPRLREAGCNLLYFGMESATRRSLVELGKLSDTAGRFRRYLDGARALVEACLRNDILPVMGILNPVPGDTEANLEETLTFVRELAELRRRLGPEARAPGPAFHAFPLRFDAGAPYEARLGAMPAQGVTFTPLPDPVFGDLYIDRASPTIGPVEAERFRQAIRACNVDTPEARRRLMRSFPRHYVQFDA